MMQIPGRNGWPTKMLCTGWRCGVMKQLAGTADLYPWMRAHAYVLSCCISGNVTLPSCPQRCSALPRVCGQIVANSLQPEPCLQRLQRQGAPG